MKKLALAGVAAFIAAAAAIWWTGIVSWERHTGYFGPAFTLDGKHLYAVVRETNGFAWGLGWERRRGTWQREPGQVTTNGVPLFEIAEAEMASGIFPDIDKALAAPGGEVERSLGKYVVHNDYTTSRGLNAHLATGAREFLVRLRGATYRMEIRHAH